MPNHVYYIMGVYGDKPEEVKKFFDNHIIELDGGGKEFDFNTLIPMPESLKGTSSPNRPPRVGGKDVPGIAVQVGGEEAHPDSDLYKEWEATTKRNLELYDADNWYDWCIENWGTKWGAYEYEVFPSRENYFTFQTAWSTPDPIFEKIGELYPNLKFDIDVCEEGAGYSGNINIRNGEVKEMLSDDMEQWKQFASDIMGYSIEDLES